MEMKTQNGVFGGTPPPKQTGKKRGLFNKVFGKGSSTFKKVFGYSDKKAPKPTPSLQNCTQEDLNCVYDKEIKTAKKKAKKSGDIKKRKQAFLMLHQNLLGFAMLENEKLRVETVEKSQTPLYPPITHPEQKGSEDGGEENQKSTKDTSMEETKAETIEIVRNEDPCSPEPRVDRLVDYVMVIGFHHHIGGQIEFIYPETKFSKNFEKSLMFYALPDGVHDSGSDYSYFMISEKDGDTYYGITSFRQIPVSKDIEGEEDNEGRGYIQKSVLVLSKIPIYNYLLTKLNITTHAYFNQNNFKDTEILTQFYQNANKVAPESLSYPDFISNTAISSISGFLGSKLLSLLKAIILERKVIIFSEVASRVSQFIIGVLTLLPGNILFKFDQGEEIQNYITATNRLGLPLKLFNDKTLLLPAASIRDLKILKASDGYFIGTTNSFLTQNSALKSDLIVNLDAHTITFADKDLEEVVSAHTEFEYEVLKKCHDKIHNSIRHYLKHLCCNMALVLHHIGNIDLLGGSEFDDQLHIKLKVLKEEQVKKLRKKHMHKKSILQNANIDIEQENTIGIVKEMQLELDDYHSADSKEKESPNGEAPNDPRVHSEPESASTSKNVSLDQAFLSHCTQKYSSRFLAQWTKTINFRIWAVEHHPQIRVQSEYAGYFENSTVYYENGQVYKGAFYKGQKLEEASQNN